MHKKIIIGFAAISFLIGGQQAKAIMPSDPIATEVAAPESALEATEQNVASASGSNYSEPKNKEADRKAKQQEKARNAKENDEHGFVITIIAMCIVVAALAVLSILFSIFGKISSSLQKSRKRKAHGVSEHEAEDHHEELDSGEVIAAISMALAEHTGHGHDIENTILTLRRMRKAYSPWNSKIYNMRHLEEPHKAGAPALKHK